MNRKWWTLLAVCSGTFMLLLDTTILYVALPAVQTDLRATFADIQWVIDAYALALATLLLSAGTLADRFGRRRLYLIGLIVFTAGSLLCGSAGSAGMLIAARWVQGVGGSIMFATGLALIGSVFEGRQRGTAFGIWGMVTGLASALGPILGGVITSGISWRGTFLINVPIGAAAIAIVALRVDEVHGSRARHLDLPGFLLFTAGLGSLVFGLIRLGEDSGDQVALGWLAAGTLLLAGFVAVEARTAEPMLDLRLFRIRTFVGGSVAALAMNGSMFAMFLYVAIYFQRALGYTPLQAGLVLLIPSVAMLVSSLVSGRLTGLVPVRWLIGPGLCVVSAGLFLMLGVDATTSWPHFVAGSVITGLGAGFVNPPLASTAIGVVDPARSGMASGVNSTFRQIGTCSSVAVLGAIFASVLGGRLAAGLAGVPQLSGRTGELIAQVRGGDLGQALAGIPAGYRAEVARLARSGFDAGLNDLFVVTGCLALVGGVLALWLIRAEDFVAPRPPAPATGSDGSAPATHPETGSAPISRPVPSRS